MDIQVTKQAEQYLEALALELEVPPSRYEQAERSYKSLGDWLHRPESQVQHLVPEIYVQGSFRLGTAIKPVSSMEQYDVDSVCVLNKLKKLDLSQADLKALLGAEIKAYRRSQSIVKPVKEGRRCWTLEYADGAQFHMDVLPCLPNGQAQRAMLESRAMDAQWADSAIAITDNEVSNYHLVTDEWPRSNPKGFAEWFKSQMIDVFRRRQRMVLNEMRVDGTKASIEDIPDYRVRTPLQSAIMILKHHRDVMYEHDQDVKPISIIISTLSAHAYENEETIAGALLSILTRMEKFIDFDGSSYSIKNPTDHLENFADKWEVHQDRREAFFNWLSKAQSDFGKAAGITEIPQISTVLAERLGRGLTDAASYRVSQPQESDRKSTLRAPTTTMAGAAPKVSFSDTPRVPKTPSGFA